MKLDIEKFNVNLAKCQILYLDSPNNPTGFQFSKAQIESLVKKFDGLVIVDEAYGEFGDSSAISLTKKHDNLIVVKTFSKAFGLAGLRLGYFVANKKIVEVFNQVLQYPYPLSTLAIEAGIASLDKVDLMKEAAEIIKSERKKIIETLRKYDAFEVFDSKANFVLFDAKGADKRVFAALVEQGISIRKLGKIGSHSGCLRVTVGTKEMNSKFLLAIRDLLG
jgi:histidinol-phosphate aminotransferase